MPFYKQKFKEIWKKEKKLQGWLQGKEGDPEARCNVCNKDLRAHLNDLRRHAETEKHLKTLQTRRGMTSLQSSGFTTSSAPALTQDMIDKSFELTMSLYSAVHTNMASMDELCNIIQAKFGRTSLNLHRTKVTALIKKVLSPHFRLELKKDLANAPFSLLIDESTDISTVKLLAVAIRYHSVEQKAIISTYLGMEEIIHADAVNIHTAIKRG